MICWAVGVLALARSDDRHSDEGVRSEAARQGTRPQTLSIKDELLSIADSSATKVLQSRILLHE